MTAPESLSELIDRLRPAGDAAEVTLGDVLRQVGSQSFAPVLLVPALLLISPLSAIPGMPTLGALIVITVTAQWLVGRRHLWLPRFVMTRTLSAQRLASALGYLDRPAAWIDRQSRDRLRALVLWPASAIAKLCILAIALTWPVLELLPMVTSIGAAAVALFAFGLMVRDGIFVVAGFAFIGLVAGLVAWLSGAA